MQGQLEITDPQYPSLLTKVKGPPRVLYYKGEFDSALFDNCVAVVGSRRMTSYGRRAAQKIVHELAGAGTTIVSGFMYGVDACAHEAALAVGGRTIAVMPCGIDCVHPESQVDLYTQILENGGLVLSEYEGSVRPQLWMYPRRNRIVAGLCRGVLVVEAASESGSLITADFARKFNRNVFVVPGGIFSENSYGIYQLLGSGALIATSGLDILKFYNWHSVGVAPKQSVHHIGMGLFDESKYIEEDIVDLLRMEPLTIDEISRQLEEPFDSLSSKLTCLCLDGVLSEEEGRYYVN